MHGLKQQKKSKPSIELVSTFETSKDVAVNHTPAPLAFHSSFHQVEEKLRKWLTRFPLAVDDSIFNDLYLVYLLASKNFLDHRNPDHLFRLVLSIHLKQKNLLRSVTITPHLRHLKIRLIPTDLIFPFSSKPVIGCLIGFNLMNRYELFDEENILLALQKHLPQLRLVKESSYCHTSHHKNLKIFYLEIEKKTGSEFSFLEKMLLKNNLEEKIKNSIQTLSPTIFMKQNEEEVYKHILVLSQEIHTLQDLPQAYITLDQQTGKEIIFRITLVYVSPFHRFSLKERFFDCAFVSERVLTVRHLENHPIEAHIFRLSLARDVSVLRSDGSLDFYSARQKVVSQMVTAIGEFRDYNGGILLKQQELLHDFKESFSEVAHRDPELIETFFYAIVPLEKQAVLQKEVLVSLFKYFLENQTEKLSSETPYTFKIYRDDQQIFLVVHSESATLKEIISEVIQDQSFTTQDLAYNIVDRAEGVFFNCVLLQTEIQNPEMLIQALRESLEEWHQKVKDRQVLRIALEYPVVSLDPRIGGEATSADIIRLLFEGLMRFNQNGNVENGVAESVEISPNLKQYIFKLRRTAWNDGSPVTAYDFEYAWKKVLSPDFKTPFAYFFLPIRNAKEAKEGKVSPEEIGIHVIDDRTLKIELVHPAPYFLEWTVHPIFSPVNRLVDQEHPQWPYECEKNYPCNGPFQLKINQFNQGCHLVKNPFYWDSHKITLDQIIFTLMRPSQAIQAFHQKEIDWLGNPFGSWYPNYTNEKEGQVLAFPNSWVCWFVFNHRLPLFQHRKMRHAFAYAIQRSRIVENAFLSLTPAYSLSNSLKDPSAGFPECDPDKARQLFQEALQELGLRKKDLPPIRLLFTERGIREYTALCLKEQFKECLGIECNLDPLPWGQVFNNVTAGNFQTGLVYWSSLVDDPIYTLNSFKSADQELNFSTWEDPDFQHLLDLSDAEINPFLRSSYLLKAEGILCKEMPIIPLFFQSVQALVNKNLHVSYRKPSGPFEFSKSFYTKEMEHENVFLETH